MSRDLTAATVTAIAQPEVYPFFAVQLSFSGGIIRMWTGQGTLTLADGTTWVGLGQLLSISSIEETSEMSVKGASITLSGIPANLIALALTEPYQGREAKIYFGINGEDVFNELFSGYMDQMNIEEGVETATIEMAVENRLIDLERARVARFTSGYQKSVYPNDDGLNFLEDLQDKKIPWGRVAE
jgi:hypothetical protein|tara:strand:+ start:6129 stop:6683 length:555 start_codon:yes stop_codon:yes gene_type:complete